jgi:hypothetical protein
MAWICAGSAPPWRSRVAKVCRQRWGRSPGIFASFPAANASLWAPALAASQPAYAAACRL